MWLSKKTSLPRYAVIREIVFNLGSVVEIVGLYVAFLLGAERYQLGISLLAICVIVNNVLSRGWLWLIKNDKE